MEFKTHDPDNLEPWKPKQKKRRMGWKAPVIGIAIIGVIGSFFVVNGHPANEQLCKKVHGGWFLRNSCYNSDS